MMGIPHIWKFHEIWSFSDCSSGCHVLLSPADTRQSASMVAMSRLVLASACVATAGAYVARTPVAFPSATSISRTAPQLARVAPASALKAARMMADDTAAASAPTEAAACIEDEAVEECTLVEWPAGKLAVPMSLARNLRLGACFFAWFFLNVMYNITNKKCQNAFPMPWTMTVVSLAVGVPYILLLWASGLRKAPKVCAHPPCSCIVKQPLIPSFPHPNLGGTTCSCAPRAG